ncbi:MAG: GNAT family N-acetyltransferase [Candidatus Cloacimonadaceae bacterium]|nr:GNAT family N-acetyltransferase [Candidatus Cloacimonadota bacterium]MDD3523553.1 GNAT family N-acetyltransferase [Candidatus Cloacimonadota bacterium]MDY0318501.1 GNAT family N-acetyltransferase [Candidatus Cloacimonadaceae bacterium]HQB97630.1 GNAT family N-acetyltransferase [Candidatus Cloacimonadota bacterium]
MSIPFNILRMKDTELHYPQRFANMTQRDYGLIFWNEGNKASAESNHAVIKDFVGIESSLRDIESFYKGKGISPRIFSSLQANELDKVSAPLQQHGFNIELTGYEYFLHDHESIVKPNEELQIQRIKHLDIDIMETIALEYGGDWTIRVVERHLQHPSYHLLGGYHHGELAALASVCTYAGYSRISDVFTREKFRGKGFAATMIHSLVLYHKGISENHLYLFSDNPATSKVYEKTGFSRLPQDFVSWTAAKELSTINSQ